MKMNKKKQFIFVSGIIVILFLILFLSSFLGNYEKLSLRKNNKDIFTIKDLTVNDLKFLSTEEEINKELGEPKKIEIITKNSYSYKEYYYSGLKLTLKENYSDYVLVGAEITSSRYKTGRKIRVGNRITKVFNKYKVENKKGNYIYKNYTIDALNDNLVKENAYFAYRTEKEVRYYNKDAVIEGNPTNVAELKISYKLGRINKITWSYDLK